MVEEYMMGLHIYICIDAANMVLRNSTGNNVADTCNSSLPPVCISLVEWHG